MFKTDQEYFQDRKYVTNSQLTKLAKSPQHLQAYYEGQNESSTSFDLGSALHLAILEPEKFEETVIVFAGKTRGVKYNKFVEENEGKIVILENEMVDLIGMKEAINNNGEAMHYINNSEKEIVETWTDADSLVQCKGKADMVGRDFIADLKTTKDVDPRRFRYSCYDYGYHRQAAFYLDGFKKERFIFVCVEKKPPYRIGIFDTSDEFIEQGREGYKELLHQYFEYFKEDTSKIKEYYIKETL